MNKSDDGKRKTGQPEWKPAGKLRQRRQPEAFLCYLFTKEWTKKVIQGGPERMQHLRSMISRKRGTE